MLERLHSNSLTFLDNLRIDEGGITTGPTTAQERYLHSDHLGSIVAVTDNHGRILERSSYDAWGKRRHLNGTDDQLFDGQGLGILPSLSTHHGFTGHEMLDDMTLVHMNGRLYDPIIARFISADPHIDGLYSTQGLNSYSYVHNNPLNATDPSGYFLKKVFKGVKKALSGLNKIRKSIGNEFNRPFYRAIRALGPVAQPLVAIASIAICQGMGPACYAAVMGSGSFTVAHANGASSSQALRIGAIAAGTAYVGAHAADWIGNFTAELQFAPNLTNVSLHGIRGGVTSMVSGGDFRSGFLAGSFGAFGDVTGLSTSQYGAALFGGIGAKLGGGSFAEGAIIAIIGRRFNHEAHEQSFLAKADQAVLDFFVANQLPSLPQSVVDFSAGLGDGLLLGFGDELRGVLNIGGVSTGSSAYLAGEITSYTAGAARLGYAATVKIGTSMASSGVAANAFRNSMKGYFRMGAFSNYRAVPYSQALSRYGNDAAVKAAAGRTNVYFNTYGAGVLAGGALGN